MFLCCFRLLPEAGARLVASPHDSYLADQDLQSPNARQHPGPPPPPHVVERPFVRAAPHHRLAGLQ